MGKIIFITGGVRSGKSAFAESYAIELYKNSQKRNLVYIASGVAFDQEMAARIKRHQQDREVAEVSWKTIEIVDEIHETEVPFKNNHVVLWDCITTWLSNVFYRTENLPETLRLVELKKYLEMLKKQIQHWKEEGVILLLVSNEVLDEPTSIFEVSLYRHILGNLHQWIVSICDEAYEMDYSINRRWK